MREKSEEEIVKGFLNRFADPGTMSTVAEQEYTRALSSTQQNIKINPLAIADHVYAHCLGPAPFLLQRDLLSMEQVNRVVNGINLVVAHHNLPVFSLEEIKERYFSEEEIFQI
jgi:hypothetical protein